MVQSVGQSNNDIKTSTAKASDIVNAITNKSTSFKKVMSGAMYSNMGSSTKSQQLSLNNKSDMGSVLKDRLNNSNKYNNNSKSSSVNNNNANTDKSSTSKVSKAIKSSSSSDISNTVSKANQAAEDIKDAIKKALNISDEQLEDAMSVLGLTAMDLFQPDNIANLVMSISGVQDAMGILTDAQLSQSFQDIMSAVEQTVDELTADTGMSAQELKEFFENYSKDTTVEDNNDGVKEALAETVDSNNNEENIPSANEQTMDNITQAVEKKIQVAEDNKSSDNLMGQNHSDKTQQSNTTVTDISANLIQNIQSSFEEVMSTSSTNSVNGADIVKQIINSVKVSGNTSIQSMEIQLNPEHLGKVNLTVTSKNGVITAQIVAQNEEVKKAIESQIATLKENFESQGIKIEAVEVTVQSHAFESGQNLQGNNSEQGKNSKGTRRHISLEEFESLGDESEELIDNLIHHEHSSVEYTA
jgi:flagellar hook-length control protein FliK